MANNKNPADIFYWNDWENDPELKSCSLAAQGLWMRCLCIARRSPEPGVVLVKGQPSGRQDLPSTLARLVGQPPETLAQLLDELIATETASVDRKGRVVCRRMLRAAGRSLKMAINGAKGANVTNGKKRGNEGLPTKTSGKSPGKDDGNPPSKRAASSNLQDSESSSASSPSPDPAREDELDDWPAEDHDGAAVLTRPPSANRSGGQRTPGDVLANIIPRPGPPEKRLKRQDRADQDMVRFLTGNRGLDTGQAWALVMAARDNEDPGHLEAAREVERISREHRLGWFDGDEHGQ